MRTFLTVRSASYRGIVVRAMRVETLSAPSETHAPQMLKRDTRVPLRYLVISVPSCWAADLPTAAAVHDDG